MKEQKFLPSFARQRARSVKSTHKKFLKEEYIPQNSVLLEALPNAKNILLEIGSGNGETAVNYASQHDELLYIACEVFSDGMVQTAGKAFEKKLSNLKFFTKDARLLLEALPQGSLESVFLFFPDPWPKTRHHKRRILNQEFLNLVFAKLKSGGSLQTATDHTLYKEHTLEVGIAQDLFDFKELPFPSWWVKTKYEKKAEKEGRTPSFFIFKKP